jgi:hypothetical protein
VAAALQSIYQFQLLPLMITCQFHAECQFLWVAVYTYLNYLFSAGDGMVYAVSVSCMFGLALLPYLYGFGDIYTFTNVSAFS